MADSDSASDAPSNSQAPPATTPAVAAAGGDDDPLIDLDAHLAALAPNARCKGLYYDAVLKQVRAAQRGWSPTSLGVEDRRYLPFLEYPYADYLRLVHGAAPLVLPDRPRGEGIRLLGRNAYRALLGSGAGRVIFGSLVSHFGMIIEQASAGWRVSMNFRAVRTVRLGPTHYELHMSELPAFLSTHQLGVVEGAMDLCGVRGTVEARVADLATAVLDVRWRE